MAKGLYIGVSSKARKPKSIYVGGGNIAKKIKKMYLGDTSGKARESYTGSTPVYKILADNSWNDTEGYQFSGKVPSSMSIITMPESRGFHINYDPKNERFVALPNSNTNKLYTMKKDATTWTTHTYSPGATGVYSDFRSAALDNNGYLFAYSRWSDYSSYVCKFIINSDGSITTTYKSSASVGENGYYPSKLVYIKDRYIWCSSYGSRAASTSGYLLYCTSDPTVGTFTGVNMNFANDGYYPPVSSLTNYIVSLQIPAVEYYNGYWYCASLYSRPDAGSNVFGCCKSTNFTNWTPVQNNTVVANTSFTGLIYIGNGYALIAASNGTSGTINSQGIWKITYSGSSFGISKVSSSVIVTGTYLGQLRQTFNGEYAYITSYSTSKLYYSADRINWTATSVSLSSPQYYSLCAVVNS